MAFAIFSIIGKPVTSRSISGTDAKIWLDDRLGERHRPPRCVNGDRTPDGEQQVLKPLTEKIRLLRDEIFTNSGPTSPLASATIEELVKAENARVRVLNATYEAGLATRTADYLKSLGVNVTETGNADQFKNTTEITFYTGKPYSVKYLVDLMKNNPLRVFHVNDPASPVDITLMLGDDWITNNTMP